MGYKIAVMGTGAVGGYAGAHMAQERRGHHLHRSLAGTC